MKVKSIEKTVCLIIITLGLTLIATCAILDQKADHIELYKYVETK